MRVLAEAGLLHQLERFGYHMRRAVPTGNIAAFFILERKINL
jgi:hypothetical protein